MAIKQFEWDKAKVMFEGGKLLADIGSSTGINQSTIGKKAKKEGWIKSKNSATILNEVKSIEDKSRLNADELKFHNEQVEELSADRLMIRTMSKNNMVGLGKKLINHDDMSINDHLFAANAIDRTSITLGVNDRHANGIAISTTVQTVAINKEDYAEVRSQMLINDDC